jgi:hypothetical protein
MGYFIFLWWQIQRNYVKGILVPMWRRSCGELVFSLSRSAYFWLELNRRS